MDITDALEHIHDKKYDYSDSIQNGLPIIWTIEQLFVQLQIAPQLNNCSKAYYLLLDFLKKGLITLDNFSHIEPLLAPYATPKDFYYLYSTESLSFFDSFGYALIKAHVLSTVHQSDEYLITLAHRAVYFEDYLDCETALFRFYLQQLDDLKIKQLTQKRRMIETSAEVRPLAIRGEKPDSGTHHFGSFEAYPKYYYLLHTKSLIELLAIANSGPIDLEEAIQNLERTVTQLLQDDHPRQMALFFGH